MTGPLKRAPEASQAGAGPWSGIALQGSAEAPPAASTVAANTAQPKGRGSLLENSGVSLAGARVEQDGRVVGVLS